MSAIHAQVSILAIGTELTTGQITNRNAAWISEKLVNLGAVVVLHETVADDRAAIAQALDRCSSVSRIIVVCGGLGPTTDDFTRECIADWLHSPLEFYEPTWTKIETRLTQLGVPVAPSNRQQAFYPKGSKVLNNPLGTADAFVCTHQDGHLYVLPGPPREIEAIWNENQLDEKLRKVLPPEITPSTLHTWSCLGVSEAHLGELTEKALEGSRFLTGYRAHRPYVEVKVWVPTLRSAESQSWFLKLESVIGKWVVGRNGEDLAQKLLNLLKNSKQYQSIDILEAGTAGTLTERLAPLLRKAENRDLALKVTVASEWQTPSNPADWVQEVLFHADENATLAIAGPDFDGAWHLGLKLGEKEFKDSIIFPLRPAPQLVTKPSAITGEFYDRSRAYAIEAALQRWASLMLR